MTKDSKKEKRHKLLEELGAYKVGMPKVPILPMTSEDKLRSAIRDLHNRVMRPPDKDIKGFLKMKNPDINEYFVDQAVALIKKDRKELIEEMSQIIIKSAVAESKDTIFVKLTKTLFNSLKEK